MLNIIENFINKMTKEDIIKFANKNNLKYTQQEIDFVYNFIKKNYKVYLYNPNSFDLSLYKNNFSNENYIFINNIFNKYKNLLK